VKQQQPHSKGAVRTADHLAPEQAKSVSRRDFLTRVPAIATVTSAATAGTSAHAGGFDVSPASANERVAQSFQIRLEAAEAESKVPIPPQITNRDEQNYPNFIGNFHKGLPHNSTNGEVDPQAYRLFLNAVRERTAAAFEKVPLGGDPSVAGGLTKLVNPLAGVAFDLEGTDSHQFALPPVPSVTSQDLADQAIELYWMALCRDVNFLDYDTHPLTQAAAAEISKLKAFSGPRLNGVITPRTLFHGFTPEDLIGPYVSQFLLKPFAYGPYAMDGTMGMYMPGLDYMTDHGSWLNVQNGRGPFAPNAVDTVRHTCTGRDLTVYVHTDPNAGLLISFYNAGIWLFEQKAPLNLGNPYRHYKKQDGFATFGVPHFLCLLAEAKQRACKSVWYAKWFVHRALRPAAYGGLVHMKATGKVKYPLHGDVMNSTALSRVFSKYGTYFLPQAFPEGSPQHPSYAHGHASMAGACATILKAAFDGSVRFNSLKDSAIETASSTDPRMLVPYTGSDADQITINGEINKLASNIGNARNFAGIHWRSDYEAAMRLGEGAAISVLRDQSDVFAGRILKVLQSLRSTGRPSRSNTFKGRQQEPLLKV
jgi:hypothetical protein